MTLKRKLSSLVLIIAVTMLLLFTATIQEASAANTCQEIDGYSSWNSVTFTVNTGSGWLLGQSLTLTQSKGTIHFLQYRPIRGNAYSNVNVYGIYYVTVRDAKSGKIWKKYNKKRWDDKNFKIKLGKKKSYTVTVTPADIYIYNVKHWEPILGKDRSWKTDSKWWVKKTRNISLCRES